MTRRTPRSSVPFEQTWDLESLFPSILAWEDAYTAAQSRLSELSHYQGRLGEVLQSPYDAFNNAVNADATFEPVTDSEGRSWPVSVATVWSLLESRDREVRKAAYLSLREGLSAYKRTLAATHATAQRRDALITGVLLELLRVSSDRHDQRERPGQLPILTGPRAGARGALRHNQPGPALDLRGCQQFSG